MALSRREFMQLAAYFTLGSVLEGSAPSKLDESTRIFMDVDSMAFFNSPLARNPVLGKELKEKEIEMSWPIRQKVSYYLAPESKQYFESRPEDNLEVMALVSECIMFCCYTKDRHSGVMSAGTYHARTLKPKKELQENLGSFINTIRPNQYSNQRIFLKASGRYGSPDQEDVIRSIEGLLKTKNIHIRDLSLDLEQTAGKINKFYPATGKMTTQMFKY
jgi:hypothetical protein